MRSSEYQNFALSTMSRILVLSQLFLSKNHTHALISVNTLCKLNVKLDHSYGSFKSNYLDFSNTGNVGLMLCCYKTMKRRLIIENTNYNHPQVQAIQLQIGPLIARKSKEKIFHFLNFLRNMTQFS